MASEVEAIIQGGATFVLGWGAIEAWGYVAANAPDIGKWLEHPVSETIHLAQTVYEGWLEAWMKVPGVGTLVKGSCKVAKYLMLVRHCGGPKAVKVKPPLGFVEGILHRPIWAAVYFGGVTAAMLLILK